MKIAEKNDLNIEPLAEKDHFVAAWRQLKFT
jgi:hypothetical protein